MAVNRSAREKRLLTPFPESILTLLLRQNADVDLVLRLMAGEYRTEVGGKKGRGAHRAEPPKKSFWKELPILLLVAFLLTFVIQTFIARVYVIPSSSMEQTLHGRRRLMYLWKEQGGICPVCHQPITHVTGWHNHHIVYKTLGGTDSAENRVLIHPNCHKQVHAKGLAVSKPRPAKAGPQAQPGALFHA